MASEVSILAVQLPVEPSSKALDTRQYTKLRFPQQPLSPQHMRLPDDRRRHEHLKPSSPREYYHQQQQQQQHQHPGMPRMRSREQLYPTPPGTPTQRYYRPRMHHGPPNKPAAPSSRPISYASSGSQHSDTHHHGDSSTSSSPLSRTPVSASEIDMDRSTIRVVDASKTDDNCAPVQPKRNVEYHTPPLNRSHFSCYHYHRTFVRSNNVLYPLNCMTCLKADQEVRWRCLFCCLRICGDCVKGIKSCKDRSLLEFMEKLVMDLEAAGAADTEKSQSENDESDTAAAAAPLEKVESTDTLDSLAPEPEHTNHPNA